MPDQESYQESYSQESYSEQPEAVARRVIIKFHDDYPEEFGTWWYADESEGMIEEHGLGPWNELAEEFPDIHLNRLYTLLKPAEIEAMVARAVEKDPTYQPINFLTYFVVEVKPEVDAEALAARFRQWESIEAAYVESPVAPPPLSLTTFLTEQDIGEQGYLGLGGINILPVWAGNSPGADGAGIGFADVERGWNLNHQELLNAAGLPKVNIMQVAFQDELAHGTNVLGIILATPNQSNIVGIAPNAQAGVLSGYSPLTGNWELSNVLLWGFNQLQDGDVCLLELQLDYTYPHRPIEAEKANYDAIRLATANNIIVIECAGNGNLNLNNLTDSDGKFILDRAHGDFRDDSKAIMVGSAVRAGPAVSDPLVRRASQLSPPSPCWTPQIEFSNYGNRLDCFAWGECVYTLDTDAAGIDHTAINPFFTGTSAAAAIIAGAALVVQGVAVAAGLGRCDPLQMRQLLTDPLRSTPSADPIGRMPNLHAIITHLLGP